MLVGRPLQVRRATSMGTHVFFLDLLSANLFPTSQNPLVVSCCSQRCYIFTRCVNTSMDSGRWLKAFEHGLRKRFKR